MDPIQPDRNFDFGGWAYCSRIYKLWHELLAWIEKQDQKRDDERDKQRTWEALQKKESDERWQFFLKRQQEQWLSQDLNQSVILSKLIDKTDTLISTINNHDTWTRAQNQNGK